MKMAPYLVCLFHLLLLVSICKEYGYLKTILQNSEWNWKVCMGEWKKGTNRILYPSLGFYVYVQ